MKLKIPSIKAVWGGFWSLVGWLLLNKIAAALVALLIAFGAGVYKSRDVLIVLHEGGTGAANFSNRQFEKLGIAYRLDPPKALPVYEETEDALLIDGPGVLPSREGSYDVNIVVNKDLYPYDGNP